MLKALKQQGIIFKFCSVETNISVIIHIITQYQNVAKDNQ